MELENAAKMCKALGSEQRIRILKLLQEWEGLDACCDGVLKAFTKAADEVHISRSTLSHHFKELENAGLISCERQGQAMSCKVNEKALSELGAFFS
jgi:ArsR family transcriptional regulator, arsenate/arsenite/antimonite-responsive transcriptional repressor